MKTMFQTGTSKKGLIHIDPRTKLFILLAGNIAVFFAPSMSYEILLVFAILIFGFLCGVYGFSLKIGAAYLALIALQIAGSSYGSSYLPGVLNVMLVSFAIFVRKIFPCAMLGGILVSTTRVNEFTAAMDRIHMPKSVVIPLAVMLRYLPMVGEEWGYIRDAMKMRDVSPSFLGLIKNPAQTLECIYVPMMMSASKIADELSVASVTRGIENPKPRSCLQQIRFRPADAVCAAGFTAFLCAAFVA